MRSVLIVCTGNICRSPTAHAVLAHFVREAGLDRTVRVDSAGTHDYHVGEPPDGRAQLHARRRGYELSGLRARQVAREDFASFDLVLAMDRGQLRILRRMSPEVHRQKIHLYMEYATGPSGDEVPDPYYGGPEGFEAVLDMVEAASRAIVAVIKEGRLSASP
jgi:protein-tyrosine phosphatase